MEPDYAEVVRRTYEMFASDDAFGMAELWTDDIVWHNPGSNVGSGDHAGASAILAMLGDIMASAQGTLQVEIKNIMTEGDRGFSLHRATAVTDDGVAEMWNVLGFRFRDGKIAEIWNYTFDQSVEDSVFS